jgi:hypothetical protein
LTDTEPFMRPRYATPPRPTRGAAQSVTKAQASAAIDREPVWIGRSGATSGIDNNCGNAPATHLLTFTRERAG